MNTEQESQTEHPLLTSLPSSGQDSPGCSLLAAESESDIQKELASAREEITRLKQELENCTQIHRFGLAKFMYDDNQIRFFTGFPSYKLLNSFLLLVTPNADNMISWAQMQRARNSNQPVSEGELELNTSPFRHQSLRLEDQLFLFLCKVKLGLFEQDLAVRFGISISTVSRMLITWTNFLYCVLGSLPIWPSRKQVNTTMPDQFKELFPNCRVIIDCMEMKVQTPSSLLLHSEFYSSYKSSTTLKSLIGITPAGAISFISSLYTGSISDKEITRRSGIIELLEPGDGVMADKGFTIEDLLIPIKCHLNIPPFLRAKPQFSLEDVQKTQRIAKLRIHVERAIRRVKEYHIFDAIVPLSLASSVNQLWTICCILTNFQGPLF